MDSFVFIFQSSWSQSKPQSHPKSLAAPRWPVRWPFFRHPGQHVTAGCARRFWEPASVRERMGASTAVKLLIGWRSHFR